MNAPVAPIGTRPLSVEDERSVERFLFGEAALLDAGRFDEWLALYADDAVYWIPAAPDQTDPLGAVSIMYEDKPILAMRVERLGHPRIYAAEPLPRTMHMVGNVTAEAAEDGGKDGAEDEIVARSTLFVATYREGPPGFHSGHVRHLLRPGPDGGFVIREKRIDLIDSDGVHGPIIVPL